MSAGGSSSGWCSNGSIGAMIPMVFRGWRAKGSNLAFIIKVDFVWEDFNSSFNNCYMFG